MAKISAASSVAQPDQPAGLRPSSARQGYQARKPTGRTVSSPPSSSGPSPSSGNILSCVSSLIDELLISSAARGAQNARLPDKNENDITIIDEAARLRTSSASQPSVIGSASLCVAQISSPRPGSSTDEPEYGMDPSVSSDTQIGCGWMSVWSSWPRPSRRLMMSTL